MAKNPNYVSDAVLNILAHTEDTTLVLSLLTDGKFAVRSKSWDENAVILPDQVLEVRMIEGRLRVAPKEKHPDAGNPFLTPAPYGTEGEIGEFE